jgi:hypothetical protein
MDSRLITKICQYDDDPLKTAVGATSYNNLFQFMHRWKLLFITFGFSSSDFWTKFIDPSQLKTMALSHPGVEITGCVVFSHFTG